jgi:hypothetical protein
MSQSCLRLYFPLSFVHMMVDVRDISTETRHYQYTDRSSRNDWGMCRYSQKKINMHSCALTMLRASPGICKEALSPLAGREILGRVLTTQRLGPSGGLCQSCGTGWRAYVQCHEGRVTFLSLELGELGLRCKISCEFS